MGGMKLEDLTTRELRKSLADTVRLAGPESQSAKILRRELDRRRAKRDRQAPKAGNRGNDDR